MSLHQESRDGWQAAGAITNNSKLRREGKLDQAAGKTKQAVGKAIDKVKDVVEGKKPRK